MQQPLAAKSEMIKRLARIEGQIRGIQRLIEGDEDCEKVIQQMTAARKALDRAFFEMLACVIEENVTSSLQPDAEGKVVLSEVKALLSKYA